MTETSSENTVRQRKWNVFGRVLAGVVLGLITIFFAAMLVTDGDTTFLFALTAIIWLPLVLIGLIVFVCNVVLLCNPETRDAFHLAIVIWGVVNILILFCVLSRNNFRMEQVDAEHLIAHYEQHEAEIWDLAEYTRAAMDSGTWMRLEFDGRKVEMFHTETADGEMINRWHSSEEPPLDADSIGSRIGLTHDEIEGIRQRLESAGCISIDLKNYGTADSINHYGKMHKIDEYDYVTIGRKRHMMSMYFYVIFRHPMSDSTWNSLLNNETCIPVCDTMALEYGSPAFGSIGYPLKKEIVERLGLKER
ncbi:MAG: hypothetical protein J6031_03135 [Bacteroidales bacterium]|nr:hypothetical protein [Bacteroidales bacterium]